MIEDWQPTGWWRVVASDGSLWSESSDEEENRESMRHDDKIYRHERRCEERWVEVPVNES